MLEDYHNPKENPKKDWNSRAYYRRNWYRVNTLKHVNTANLVGLSLKELTDKYFPLLRDEYRSIYWMLEFLHIDKAIVENNKVYLTGWRSNRELIYYLNPITQLVCISDKRQKKHKVPKHERMKEFYYKKQQAVKSAKEKKLLKEQQYQDLLHNITAKRKEKEEKINLQKIISHGFDPILSFRNFPKQ